MSGPSEQQKKDFLAGIIVDTSRKFDEKINNLRDSYYGQNNQPWKHPSTIIDELKSLKTLLETITESTIKPESKDAKKQIKRIDNHIRNMLFHNHF